MTDIHFWIYISLGLDGFCKNPLECLIQKSLHRTIGVSPDWLVGSVMTQVESWWNVITVQYRFKHKSIQWSCFSQSCSVKHPICQTCTWLSEWRLGWVSRCLLLFLGHKFNMWSNLRDETACVVYTVVNDDWEFPIYEIRQRDVGKRW